MKNTDIMKIEKEILKNETYIKDEVVKSSLEYFDGNDLASEAWMNKYAMKNRKDEYCEKTPKDTHKRMAVEFARIENKFDSKIIIKSKDLSEYGKKRTVLNEEKIFHYFDKFKYIIPQGSVMSVLGNPYVIGSLSNCIVLPELFDSYAGVCYADQQLVQLMKRRCVEENSFVNTKEKGLIKIKDVQIGMHILSFDKIKNESVYKAISDKFYSEVKKENRVVVTLENGTTLKTSKEHPILVFDNNGYSYKNIGNVSVGETCINPKFIGSFNNNIEENLKQIGWFIGAHIGDGSCGHITLRNRKKYGKKLYEYKRYRFRIVGNEENVVKKYTKILNSLNGSKAKYNISKRKDYKCTCWEYSNSVIKNEKILKKYIDNQYGKKSLTAFIPSFIKENNLWFPFIAGLVDTDGYIRKDGGSLVINICAKKVIDELSSYLSSIGISYNYSCYNPYKRKKEHYIKDRNPMHRLTIHLSEFVLENIVPYMIHDEKVKRLKKHKIKEFSKKNLLSNEEFDDILKNYGNMKYGSRSNNLAACIKNLKKEKSIGKGAINEFEKNNVITIEKKEEITKRSKIVSIEKDIKSIKYVDLEIDETNNFYSGNFGLLCVHNCGAGMSISNLRPENTEVSNAAGTSTGAISFMERFSNTTREVAQSGRRGALMITMDIQHPDIEKFVTIKQDLKKITGANISVQISDEFMEAVQKNKNYTHRWPINSENPKVTKVVNARELWNKIIESAHKVAEPGILFWDKQHKYSTSSIYPEFKNVSTNPCIIGSTLVAVADGRNAVSIKGLVEENKEFPVYTIKNKKVKISNATAFKTGDKKKVVKIILDDGSDFICTPDHKIMLRGGTYEETSKLIEGQSLMSFNSYISNDKRNVVLKEKETELYNHKVVSVEDFGYEDVYDLNVPETSNFGIITSNKDDKFIESSGVFVHNCGEIAMGNDSCRLVSLNMFECVKNPFTKEAEFDFEKWYEIAYEGQRINDDLVDLELEAIEKMLKKIENDPEPDYIKQIEIKTWKDLYNAGKNGRRTGLGFLALADTIAALSVKFDSNKSLQIIKEIMKTKCKGEFDSSIDMAIERGIFKGFDEKIENESEFVYMMKEEMPEIYDRMMKFGRRNVSLSMVAPTGTMSLIAQTSSGVEPVFELAYKRRRKINPNDKDAKVDFTDDLGDKWQEYDVVHPKVKLWKEVTGKEDVKESPWFGATAEAIDWLKRIKIQSIIQKYTTHSISSTINLPEDTSIETVSEIYQKSWKHGLKGITVYRAGSRSGVMISKEEQAKIKQRKFFEENNAPKRPKTLDAEVITFFNDKEKWIGFVGVLEGRPYEIFTGKLDNFPLPSHVNSGQIKRNKIINSEGKKVSKYDFIFTDKSGDEITIENLNKSFNPDYWNYAKMISGILRHGMPLPFVVELISGLNLGEETLTTWKIGVIRTIKKYIKDGTQAKDTLCPNCKDENGLIYEEGCLKCKNCGWGQCG